MNFSPAFHFKKANKGRRRKHHESLFAFSKSTIFLFKYFSHGESAKLFDRMRLIPIPPPPTTTSSFHAFSFPFFPSQASYAKQSPAKKTPFSFPSFFPIKITVLQMSPAVTQNPLLFLSTQKRNHHLAWMALRKRDCVISYAVKLFPMKLNSYEIFFKTFSLTVIILFCKENPVRSLVMYA